MRRRLLLVASSVLGLASGCDLFVTSDYAAEIIDSETFATDDYSGWPARDADDDGWFANDGDCDDDDPDVNPGADEICDDGIDNDCDGLTDGEDEDCVE